MFTVTDRHHIPPAIALAQQFGDYITQENYPAAHGLLTPALQRTTSPDTLQQAVQTMTQGQGTLQTAIAMADCLLTEWQYPPMEPADVVWLYVSLEGEGFAEAVSVIVAQQGESLGIRWLEWGRP